MMTKALPLKKRAYTLETRPTDSAPTAAGMSFWFGNFKPVKWFATQPMQAIPTRSG